MFAVLSGTVGKCTATRVPTFSPQYRRSSWRSQYACAAAATTSSTSPALERLPMTVALQWALSEEHCTQHSKKFHPVLLSLFFDWCRVVRANEWKWNWSRLHGIQFALEHAGSGLRSGLVSFSLHGGKRVVSVRQNRPLCWVPLKGEKTFQEASFSNCADLILCTP